MELLQTAGCHEKRTEGPEAIYVTSKIIQKEWRSRVSIPAPPACKAGALPSELDPRHHQLCNKIFSTGVFNYFF